MEYLSYGTGRVVFKFDDNNVVKIPYNKSGVEQNRQEYETYTANKALQVYGECRLDENNWLYMEYLEDCSTEYYNHDDNIHCSIYDDSTAQTLIFTCDGNCANCKHNTFVPFTHNELEKIETYKTNDRVQIGRDKNGILKFYDYATIIPTDFKFLFDAAYLNLFNEYLAESNYKILFVDWVADKELPRAVGNREKTYKHANRFKRKLFIQKMITQEDNRNDL